jgi:hypothetical protein
MVIAFNTSAETCTIDIMLDGLGIEDDMLLHDQVSARSYVVRDQRVQQVHIPAQAGAVLLVSRR